MNQPVPLWRWLIAVMTLALSAAMPADAGEFVINPLRVTLDRVARASEVVVRNDDSAPLRMQVQAMRWTQDAQGVDHYEPAEDLLYFPRTMEIAPGESRVVRVGVRAAPVTREEAYRLFIEELPPASPPEQQAQGTSLRIFLRIGVAVFVAPAKPERTGEITSVDLRGRQVEWVVANGGNVHIRADRVAIAGIARDGGRLFSKEFPDRYFLAGASRILRMDVPPEACGQLAAIEASVEAERLNLRRKLDVAPGACK
jgi:fimbrial chaperone protein